MLDKVFELPVINNHGPLKRYGQTSRGYVNITINQLPYHPIPFAITFKEAPLPVIWCSCCHCEVERFLQVFQNVLCGDSR